LYPTNRVVVMLGWFATPMPAFLAIGIWFVFQLISGLGVLGSGSQAGGVAYAAHIGGFIAGLILIKIFALGRRPPDRYYEREFYVRTPLACSRTRERVRTQKEIEAGMRSPLHIPASTHGHLAATELENLLVSVEVE
jgi:hypothetical protein